MKKKTNKQKTLPNKQTKPNQHTHKTTAKLKQKRTPESGKGVGEWGLLVVEGQGGRDAEQDSTQCIKLSSNN